MVVNRIEFGQPSPVTSEAEVVQMLRTLKTGLREILETRGSGTKFEFLYRNAYMLVSRRQGDRLYSLVRELITEHVVEKLRSSLIAALRGDFLRVLNSTWSEYQISLTFARDILMYLDRVLVQKAGVFDLGIAVFRDQIVRHAAIRQRMRDTLQDLVKRDRSGEMVDRSSIRGTCHMLVTLGLDSRSVYEEDFESHFLSKTSEFYRLESHRLLLQDNAAAYVRRVEARLAEEVDRAKRCFNSTTAAFTVQMVEEELITKHIKTILDTENYGLVQMLKNNQVSDLGCMYHMFKRVPDGIKLMTMSICTHLRQRGKALVTEQEGTKVDATAYVQNLFDLKEHFDDLLRNCFDSDSFLKQKVATEFEYLLNLNPRSPEYLSLYIDAKIRRGFRRTSEQELEDSLDKTMVLFRLLRDKDVFEHYYKQHLERRLLLRKNVSEVLEKQMLVKLKTECGFKFASQLESMFTDVKDSRIMMEEFQSYKNSAKFDLNRININVRVLTSGLWPSQVGPTKFNLPASPRGAFEAFRRYYLGKHGGRQLILQPQLGWADLKCIFYPSRRSVGAEMGGKELMLGYKHILQVSTYQMCILLLFNAMDRPSYEDISKDTAIPERELKRALQSLVSDSHPILVKHPRTMGIESFHHFAVNEAFTSRRHRIRLRQADSTETRAKAEAGRKCEIEAAIVRVLKARKRLQHNLLVTEVTHQLSPRFCPGPVAIKKSLEGLIEREYIARAPEDRKIYTYVA